jgi:hypothetical protein
MTLDFSTNHPLPVTHNSGIATWFGNYEAEKMP